ncbi:MAG: hypothetical protein AAB922_04360 [Patescibacteria group bacterium]
MRIDDAGIIDTRKENMKNIIVDKIMNTKRKRRSLSNSIFIFENTKDFRSIWGAILDHGYMDITNNYFAILKPSWKTKLIGWIVQLGNI